jgi:hypothetical protein
VSGVGGVMPPEYISSHSACSCPDVNGWREGVGRWERGKKQGSAGWEAADATIYPFRRVATLAGDSPFAGVFRGDDVITPYESGCITIGHRGGAHHSVFHILIGHRRSTHLISSRVCLHLVRTTRGILPLIQDATRRDAALLSPLMFPSKGASIAWSALSGEMIRALWLIRGHHSFRGVLGRFSRATASVI